MGRFVAGTMCGLILGMAASALADVCTVKGASGWNVFIIVNDRQSNQYSCDQMNIYSTRVECSQVQAALPQVR